MKTINMRLVIVTQLPYNNYGGLFQNFGQQQVFKRLWHESKTKVS